MSIDICIPVVHNGVSGRLDAVDDLLQRSSELRGTDPARALAYAEEAHRSVRGANDSAGIAAALREMAFAEMWLARYEAMREHSREALEIFRELGDRRHEASCINLLGVASRRTGECESAIDMHLESLAICREIGDREEEVIGLNALSNAYRMRSEYESSIEMSKMALVIARELGMRLEESSALLSIGNTYEKIGRYHDALAMYESSLRIAEEIGSTRIRAYATGNIALVHEVLGNSAKALTYELMSLRLKEMLNDLWGMGVSFNNIAMVYKNLGDYVSALEAHFRSLEITEQIGDREGESVALNNIGQLYCLLGESSRVLEYHLKSLKIAQEIGYRQGEAFSYNHIGSYYASLGDHRQALLNFYRSYRIHEATNNPNGVLDALKNIGNVFLDLRDYERTEKYLHRSFTLAKEIGAREGEVTSSLGLGELYVAKGDYLDAKAHFEYALAAAIEAGHSSETIQAYTALAELHIRMGDVVRSAEYRRLYREFMQRSFSEETSHRVRQMLADLEGVRARRRGVEGVFAEDLEEIEEVMRAASSQKKSVEPLRLLEIRPEINGARSAVRNRAREGSDTAVQETRGIRVCTFGDLHVSIDGRELGKGDWRRKRARELFKLLLVHHRKPLTIDEIVEVLWGGAGDRNAEMLVMNAISHIRKALEPERNPHGVSSFLVSSDRAYTLDLGPDAEIDFLRFKELIVAARRGTTAEERSRFYFEATALYKDDFLKEDYYVEWTTSERDLLKDAYLEALEFLAGEHLRNDRVEEAVELARRILAHDNTSERGYEVLLLALRRRGRLGEARRVLDECEKHFRAQIGVAPPEHLRSILESVAA